jgi:hypothetical protein
MAAETGRMAEFTDPEQRIESALQVPPTVRDRTEIVLADLSNRTSHWTAVDPEPVVQTWKSEARIAGSPTESSLSTEVPSVCEIW